jgi:hypothetical protein
MSRAGLMDRERLRGMTHEELLDFVFLLCEKLEYRLGNLDRRIQTLEEQA